MLGRTAGRRRCHQPGGRGAFSVWGPVRAKGAHAGGGAFPEALSSPARRSMSRSAGTSNAVVMGWHSEKLRCLKRLPLREATGTLPNGAVASQGTAVLTPATLPSKAPLRGLSWGGTFLSPPDVPAGRAAVAAADARIRAPFPLGRPDRRGRRPRVRRIPLAGPRVDPGHVLFRIRKPHRVPPRGDRGHLGRGRIPRRASRTRNPAGVTPCGSSLASQAHLGSRTRAPSSGT